eukprot:166063_1
MPDVLFNSLFMDNDSMSITKCTDLFNNARTIAFTEMPYNYLVANVQKFCTALISFTSNQHNQKKGLRSVILKSVELTHSKFSVVLRRIMQQFNLQTQNVLMTYVFDFNMNHVIQLQIEKIKWCNENANGNNAIKLNTNNQENVDSNNEENLDYKQEEMVNPPKKKNSISEISLSYLDEFAKELDDLDEESYEDHVETNVEVEHDVLIEIEMNKLNTNNDIYYE